MKKVIEFLMLFLILASFRAYSYTLNYDELSNYIRTFAKNEVREQVLKYSSDFEISITGIIKETIQTPDSKRPNIEIVSQSPDFKVNSYKRVIIKDLNNNIIKSFPINVQTKIYKDVLVASEIIPYGSEINAFNTKLERKDITSYLDKTVSSLQNGYTSTKNYQKGAIILTNSLKEKSAVLKNSTVDIVFLSSKGLKIKIQGHALNSGSIGDTILVRSDKYNKTYNATVNSSNEVTVRI